MKDGFDVDVAFDKHSRRLGAHTRLRARPIWDVDGIDTRGF